MRTDERRHSSSQTKPFGFKIRSNHSPTIGGGSSGYPPISPSIPTPSLSTQMRHSASSPATTSIISQSLPTSILKDGKAQSEKPSNFKVGFLEGKKVCDFSNKNFKLCTLKTIIQI
uniref:Uncharacterized protein n=1 Tax=Panagrolaimus davidi TaxID=227884 RepID=A0A914R960_9BILA